MWWCIADAARCCAASCAIACACANCVTGASSTQSAASAASERRSSEGEGVIEGEYAAGRRAKQETAPGITDATMGVRPRGRIPHCVGQRTARIAKPSPAFAEPADMALGTAFGVFELRSAVRTGAVQGGIAAVEDQLLAGVAGHQCGRRFC